MLMTARPAFDPDEEITEVVPMFVDRDGRRAFDRRRLDRRGSAVKVLWFHGERRSDDRRGRQRRGDERMPACLELEEVLGKYMFYRYTADISADGISVRNALPHPRQTLVLLRFHLPDELEDVQIRCWARVVGVCDGGSGMRYHFVGLSREAQQRIARFVEDLSRNVAAA